MNKLVISLLVLLLLAGGVYYLLRGDVSDVSDIDRSDQVEEGTNTSAMLAEENAVIVSEQRPGARVHGLAVLAAPGYLVIHEDKDGAPGAILGASALLPAGETSTEVTLSRAARDGETLHAMLHFEKGSNTTFSAAEDTPVPSSAGGPISGWFIISKDAPLDLPISI